MSVKKLALCTIISAVFWCSLTIGTDVPQGSLELKMVQVVSAAFFHVTTVKISHPLLSVLRLFISWEFLNL